MATHSTNKNLLLLKETIITNLYERIKNDRGIVEKANEILLVASVLIEKARNEHELIAIYDFITTRLEIVSDDCEHFGNATLGYTLRQISAALYECIKHYQPHNDINKTDLIKLLWPHNCWDMASLKNVFLNYIFENALMFGPGDIFTDEFISTHKAKIKKARKLRDLIRVYVGIKEDARLVGMKCYEQGNCEEAWKYVVVSRIVGFMLSDFEHCLAVRAGTFKWLGFCFVYL